MGAATSIRRCHHAAVLTVGVAAIAIVAAALVAAVGAAAAAVGSPSAPHAVGTLATKSLAVKAWGTPPRPTVVDIARLRQAARQGEVDVSELDLGVRRFFVDFCDGPVTLNATCPCYFKPRLRSSAAGISLDVTLALAPRQPAGTTAAVLEAAERSLAAAAIDGAPVDKPDERHEFVFTAPGVLIQEPVTVTVTATKRGGTDDLPASAECPVQLNLIFRPVEPVCARLDISATGQGEVVGVPSSQRSGVSAARPLSAGGDNTPPTRHVDGSGARLGPRIVGGTRLDDPATRAWVVQLLLKRGTKEVVSLCSGFLIARRHVLTAGHCRPQAGDIVSFLPATPRPGGDKAAPRAARTNITVSEGVVHPDYNGIYDNDVAVVRLADDAPTWPPPAARNGSGGALPPPPQVVINHNASLPVDNAGSRVAGFGSVTEGWGSRDAFERSVDLRITPPAECEAILAAINLRRGDNETEAGENHTPELHVCAAVPGRRCSACFGDSGGPLYHTLQLRTTDADGPLATVPLVVGIVSGGVACALPGVPSVYTRVSHVAEWIDGVVGAHTGLPAGGWQRL